MGYLIALKFDTQKGGVRAHFSTKFGQNTTNTHKDICDYLQKNNTNMLSYPQGKLRMARS